MNHGRGGLVGNQRLELTVLGTSPSSLIMGEGPSLSMSEEYQHRVELGAMHKTKHCTRQK
jgi:hypothetical protein